MGKPATRPEDMVERMKLSSNMRSIASRRASISRNGFQRSIAISVLTPCVVLGASGQKSCRSVLSGTLRGSRRHPACTTGATADDRRGSGAQMSQTESGAAQQSLQRRIERELEERAGINAIVEVR